MRRWVKARSTGIALITKDARGKPKLRYVYDVADTRPVRGAKIPYLWEMTAEKSGAVAEALERQYGPTEESDIGWTLMEQAKRAVSEVYRDHLEDLRYDVRDSFLEELDDLNLEVRYKNLLTASVQYTLLTRCGLDPSEYLEDEDLAGIVEFPPPPSFTIWAAPPAKSPWTFWKKSAAPSRPMTGNRRKIKKKILKNLLQNRL